MHGEHEVGAALEVEPEVDAVGERLLERVAETAAGGVRDADDAIREEEQDGDDDGGLGAEILAHDVLRGAPTPICRQPRWHALVFFLWPASGWTRMI